jgi:uncharacterized protein (TIGR03435 family)
MGSSRTLMLLIGAAWSLHASPAQSQTAATALPKFEVASVKAVPQPWPEMRPKRSGGRITWTTDLRHLVEYAYRLQVWRVSGPLPGSDFIYAVDATTDLAATEGQVRLMFQSLLADRFKMAAHRVTKDVDGYALTVARSGLKIKEAKADDQPVPLPEWFQRSRAGAADLEGKTVATGEGPGITAITGRGVSMFQFTEALQLVLQLNVFDKTGLPGNYYFALKFAEEEAPADTDVPSLFTAVQDLGLKLEKQKVPVEMLIIDRIDKVPTEN